MSRPFPRKGETGAIGLRNSGGTATVDRSSFQGLEMAGGKAVKDLNDLLRISGDSYRRNAKLIDGVMRF